jgi:hypothetical protein
MLKQILAAALAFCCALPLHAQIIPFDSNRWEIDAKESRVEEYLGRRSLFLKGGLALVKDAKFLNGVIEFDIAFSPERTFVGTIWRVLDKRNYEEFIFVRINPAIRCESIHADFNGVAGWRSSTMVKTSRPRALSFQRMDAHQNHRHR